MTSLPQHRAGSENLPSSQFLTTHWSVVLQAVGNDSPQAAAALEKLCLGYWYPLYAYVRRKGHPPHDAQDLVQDFFALLLGKNYLRNADPNRGRFRSFLLTALKHFLVNEWKKVNCEKRGGGQHLLSLDEETAEARFVAEPAIEQPPDVVYDRGWATLVLERALAALRAEFECSGKQDLFDRLKVFVWGEKNALSYSEIGKQLLITEGAVKVAVHRLRQRYGELLRTEIANTVTTQVEVEEELRYLISVIRGGKLEISGNPAGQML
jgi:RNA polymerase sigma factor (sigma-70 family)